MDVSARITSKGQVTVPKAVRDALGLEVGDALLFRVDGQRAVVARTPDLLHLAGTIAIPAGKHATSWDDVVRATRRSRAAGRA